MNLEKIGLNRSLYTIDKQIQLLRLLKNDGCKLGDTETAKGKLYTKLYNKIQNRYNVIQKPIEKIKCKHIFTRDSKNHLKGDKCDNDAKEKYDGYCSHHKITRTENSTSQCQFVFKRTHTVDNNQIIKAGDRCTNNVDKENYCSRHYKHIKKIQSKIPRLDEILI